MKATPSLILTSLLGGFLLGVVLFSYFAPPVAVTIAAVCVILAGVVATRRRSAMGAPPLTKRGLGGVEGPTQGALLISLFLLGLTLGALRFTMAAPGDFSVAHHVGEDRDVVGIIVDREDGERSQKIKLDELSVDGVRADNHVLLFAPGFPKANVGDKIGVHCDLEKPEPFDGFAYDRYLAAKNIYATCRTHDVPFVLEVGARRGILVVIAKFHEAATARIETIFGEPQSALLAGLLMGDDEFSEEWKERFIRTGTSHVVAASGYNVSVVSLLTFGFLLYLGVKRQHAFPFILLVIAGFVILAGAEAAVTRAGIMGALALTATHIGRKSTPRNIILLTVCGMLLLEPRILRDDVGFQLSVLSTVGLILLARPFGEKLSFIPDTFGIRESFASTLAATLATLPVIIFGFGRFSLVSPFVNLLVLPFVPYAMASGMLVILADFVAPFLSSTIALPAWLALTTILEVIRAMSELPFAVISI